MSMILAATLGAALLAAPDRVGIVTVGDPATISDLQAALEVRLRAMSPPPAGADALAPFLSRPGSASTVTRAPQDPEFRKQSTDLFQQATDAFFDGSVAYSLDRLSSLAALHARQPEQVTAGERIRLHLWRTAVFGALKDEPHSDEEALAALSLDPELKVDLTEFPPSVGEAVEKMRPRVRLVTVLLDGLPPGAKVTVDERAVTTPFRVAAGTHRLVAQAPGRRELVKVFEATADLKLSLSAPIDYTPGTEAALATIVSTGTVPPRAEPLLATLREQAGIDVLLVVRAADGEVRAALLRLPGGPAFASDPIRGADPASAISAWVGKAMPKVAAPAARRPGGGAQRFLATVGGSFAQRARSFSAGDTEFDTPFSGAGPAVELTGSFGGVVAGASVAYTRWSFSKVEFLLPAGRDEIGGGSSLAVALDGAWRHRFRGDDAGPWVQAGLGIVRESHTAEVVEDELGTAQPGLNAGYVRTAVVARVGGGLSAGAVGLSAEASVAPFTRWDDDPARATGTNPSASVALGWRLGAALPLTGRLGLALDYAGERRAVSFSGAVDASGVGSPEDAELVETFHRVTLGTTVRF